MSDSEGAVTEVRKRGRPAKTEAKVFLFCIQRDKGLIINLLNPTM